MTDELRKIEQLVARNAALRHLLAEIYMGRWRDTELPQEMREAIGRALLPGREG